MERTQQDTYDELSLYTLQLGDPSFVHQHIVDAYAAQHADERTKPLKLSFALLGLYLYLERGYTGKEVQLAHMKMAKEKKQWPVFNLPEQRGDITVSDVLDTEPGAIRDAMIRTWCESVWHAWSESHDAVARLAKIELGV